MSSQTIHDNPPDAMLFPIEILTHIFRTAYCTDARFHLTLRHISRMCRDIARQLKFCSMFIQGPEQLHLIVQQLAEYPGNIPLVEHVAITDHNQPARRDTPGHKSKPWPNRHPNVQMNVTARPSRNGNSVYDEEARMFARDSDLRAFLDMVAPTLRTLHVSLYSPNLSMYSEIFSPGYLRTYPQLEELAYRGTRGMTLVPLPTLAGGAARTDLTAFPQLRRLWLSGPRNYDDDAEREFLSNLARDCPRLTHLCLHEQNAYTLQCFLAMFMRWHGVQIGEQIQVVPRVMGGYDWDQQKRLDIVAVLQTNALIGFPHLQRLIIDLIPEEGHRHRAALSIYDREILYAVARRRREVVIRWCHDCGTPRGRAPLPFVRNLFERSVSGDSELWTPKNELFQGEEAKRWQPIRVCLPYYRPLSAYRAHIAVSSSPENLGWPAWFINSQETDDFE